MNSYPAYYGDEGWWDCEITALLENHMWRVTHWQPIPEPPVNSAALAAYRKEK